MARAHIMSVPTTVYDVAAGAVTETRTTPFLILPPENQSVCQTCGVEHDADAPHDATSLRYQYAFRSVHGRWPTWKDALAHCDEAVRIEWEAALRKRGAWTE